MRVMTMLLLRHRADDLLPLVETVIPDASVRADATMIEVATAIGHVRDLDADRRVPIVVVVVGLHLHLDRNRDPDLLPMRDDEEDGGSPFY